MLTYNEVQAVVLAPSTPLQLGLYNMSAWVTPAEVITGALSTHPVVVFWCAMMPRKYNWRLRGKPCLQLYFLGIIAHQSLTTEYALKAPGL